MKTIKETITLQLFGSPRIIRDNQPLSVNTRKAIALIAYLAVAAQPCGRETLTALLWPELDHRRSRAALRTTLSALKKAMGGIGLTVERGAIGLDLDVVECDVTQFLVLLEQVKNESCPLKIDRLSQAATLYHGDFMVGFGLADSAAFDEWQQYQADSLNQQMSRVLEQLALCYEAEGKIDRAIDFAQRWATHDPLHETAHRQLMKLYAAKNQRTAALRQYQTCVRILKEELGVLPDTETTTLYTHIRDAKTPAPIDKRPATGPLPATPLVGRAAELAQIQQRLADPNCRLLTLVGVGGMGKTRLALAIAQSCPDRFADGCVFVPLAAVNDGRFLITSIANSLRFSFYGRSAPRQQLLDYLRPKNLLLILDNFEHLLTTVDLLSEIQSQAPNVKILVTSRERLHLHGEWLVEVRGLRYPKDSRNDTAAPRSEFTAIQLFQQSARRLIPNFSAAENWPAITRICQFVDGLPLGIELAAAWVRALPCHEIAAEIERNRDMLSTNLRDLPERHRSLRSVFDHSWHLLTAPEQKSFRQLSVLRGGFDRETAAVVAGTTLPQLADLVDKSLLRQMKDGRYAIPEALLPYVAEKLQSQPNEQQAVKTKHSRYFANFLQQREHNLKGGRQQEALAEINALIENVRLAWQWAVEMQDNATLDKAAPSLALFYEMRNDFQEGAAMFEMAAHLSHAKALARQGSFYHRLGRHEESLTLLQKSLSITQTLDTTEENQVDMAFALNNLGYVAWSASQYEQARIFYKQSLTIYRQIGDQWGIARTLNNQAIIPQDLTATRTLLEESQRIADEIDDLWGLARTLNNLGIVATNRQSAKQLYERCIAICQDIGDRFLMTFPLTNLGHTMRQEGLFADARQFYKRSLAICQEIGYRAGAARNLGHLGMVDYALGDYDMAEHRCQKGLTISRAVGDQRGLGLLLHTSGLIAREHGRLNAAEEHFQTSLDIFRAAGDQQGAAWPLLGLTRLAYLRNDMSQASEWGRESLAIFRDVDDKDGIARALTTLGAMAVAQNQMESAPERLTEALNIATTLQAVPLMLTTLTAIAAMRMRQNRHEDALVLLDVVCLHPGAEKATRNEAMRTRLALAAKMAGELTAISRKQSTHSLEDVTAAILAEELNAPPFE